jgi:hypothetical protein
MEISKDELEQIIKEEIDAAMEEGLWNQTVARAKGAWAGAKKGVASKAKSGAAKVASLAGEKDVADRLRQRASDTAAQGVEAKRRARGVHVANKSYESFLGDLKALGLHKDPEFREPLKRMRTAIKKLGGEAKATPDQTSTQLATPAVRAAEE